MDSIEIVMDAVRKSYAFIGCPEKILVGLSGGADSVALLLALSALRNEKNLRLFAVHVNHGLRANAALDESFCQLLCRQMRIPFQAFSVDVEREGSIEAAARTARYEAFERAMQETGASVLALAHHADDQAETVLMHLLHGSGADGLGGMRVWNGKVWRPLLNIRRGDVRSFLKAQGQSWREDESNADIAFTRNRIRAQMIPALESFSPQLVPVLCRTAEILRDESDFLQALAKEWLGENAAQGRYRFMLTQPLVQQHAAMQRRILRGYAALCGLELDYQQTERLRALLMRNAGSTENLPHKWQALRTETRLHFLPPFAEEAKLSASNWQLIVRDFQGKAENGLNSQCIPAELLEGACLRTRQSGDYIQPFGMQGKKSLKEYMIDRRVDRPFRDGWPLLCQGQEVLWVIGIGASERLRCNDATHSMRQMIFSGDLPDKI